MSREATMTRDRVFGQGAALPTLPDATNYPTNAGFIRTTDYTLWVVSTDGTTWQQIGSGGGYTADPYLAAQGLIAETSPRASLSNNTAMTIGTEYFVAVKLQAGMTVTKLGSEFTGAGSALTLFKWALRDKTGARVAVTADEKANVASGTPLRPVLVNYPVTITDLYYASVLATGTTGPTVVRGLGHSVDTRATGATYGHMGTLTGQTDCQLTAAINFAGASMLPIWIGVG